MFTENPPITLHSEDWIPFAATSVTQARHSKTDTFKLDVCSNHRYIKLLHERAPLALAHQAGIPQSGPAHHPKLIPSTRPTAGPSCPLPHDMVVPEGLTMADLHRDVCRGPGGMVADAVTELLELLQRQGLARGLIERAQQPGVLLKTHQGICFVVELEEPGEKANTALVLLRETTSIANSSSPNISAGDFPHSSSRGVMLLPRKEGRLLH